MLHAKTVIRQQKNAKNTNKTVTNFPLLRSINIQTGPAGPVSEPPRPANQIRPPGAEFTYRLVFDEHFIACRKKAGYRQP